MHGERILAISCLLALGLGAGARAAQPDCRPGVGTRALRLLPSQTWRHELAWTLSSDDVLFGAIGNAALLDSGCVAVADLQLGNVLIVGPGGEVVRVLPAQGEGPGRVTRLTQVVGVPGEGLALLQSWPARVEVVRLDGTPLRTLKPNPAGDEADVGILELQWSPAGLLAALCEVDLRGAESTSRLRLVLLGDDLGVARTFHEATFVTRDVEGVVDETVGWFPRGAWTAVGPDGFLFCPCRDRFRICLTDVAGRRLRAWERDLGPVPRPAREVEILEAGYRWTVNGVERPLEFRLFATSEMIRDLVPLEGRGVLAVSARIDLALGGRGTARLDLLDPQEGTAREIYLGIPYRHLQDQLFLMPTRDLLVVTDGYGSLPGGASGQAAPPAIECWRFREVAP